MKNLIQDEVIKHVVTGRQRCRKIGGQVENALNIHLNPRNFVISIN
jgi:hypothetical protein